MGTHPELQVKESGPLGTFSFQNLFVKNQFAFTSAITTIGGGHCRRRPALLRNVETTRILDRAGTVIQSRRAIQGETKIHMKDAIKFALTLSRASGWIVGKPHLTPLSSNRTSS
jgi:hypothetical protein